MLVSIYCESSPSWHDLPEKGEPDRVWFWGKRDAPTKHSELPASATLMHKGHDFRIQDKRFRYMYSGGDQSWVVFEYGSAPEVECASLSCGEEISSEANFCMFCGMKQ